MFSVAREDLRIMKVKGWRYITMDRDAYVWRLLVQGAKAHKGLQSQLVVVVVVVVFSYDIMQSFGR